MDSLDSFFNFGADSDTFAEICSKEIESITS